MNLYTSTILESLSRNLWTTFYQDCLLVVSSHIGQPFDFFPYMLLLIFIVFLFIYTLSFILSIYLFIRSNWLGLNSVSHLVCLPHLMDIMLYVIFSSLLEVALSSTNVGICVSNKKNSRLLVYRTRLLNKVRCFCTLVMFCLWLSIFI